MNGETAGTARRSVEALIEALTARTAEVGVIGLGYVGLPLAIAAARAGHRVTGFDVDDEKVVALAAGDTYIESVPQETLREAIAGQRFQATADFSRLAACDIVVICVPTPLTRQREPDLSYVEQTVATIARHRKAGATVILESTTWPWTTETVVKGILEADGSRSGVDFFLGFSPEREDPGNRSFRTVTIPKIVSGDGEEALAIVSAFYASVVEKVVPVSSPRAAEAVKITENIFRAVNIALVNELKVIYDAMDIDVWEIIDAAATKPFGFMPFYPGPGLGGHCIPIDPFYLTWKAREYNVATRFIELAGEINVSMPRYVVSRLEHELDRRFARSLGASKVLVLGLAYKKNVPDIRESPAFALMHLLEARGTRFDYHDPHVPEIPHTRSTRSIAAGGRGRSRPRRWRNTMRSSSSPTMTRSTTGWWRRRRGSSSTRAMPSAGGASPRSASRRPERPPSRRPRQPQAHQPGAAPDAELPVDAEDVLVGRRYGDPDPEGDVLLRGIGQEEAEHRALGRRHRRRGDEQAVAQHQPAVEPLDAAEGEREPGDVGVAEPAVGVEAEVGFAVAVEREGDEGGIVDSRRPVVLAVERRGEPRPRQVAPEGIGPEPADVPQGQQERGVDLAPVPDLEDRPEPFLGRRRRRLGRCRQGLHRGHPPAFERIVVIGRGDAYRTRPGGVPGARDPAQRRHQECCRFLRPAGLDIRQLVPYPVNPLLVGGYHLACSGMLHVGRRSGMEKPRRRGLCPICPGGDLLLSSPRVP